MNKLNNFLNTLSIFTTLIILALCYWARMGLPSYISAFNYVSLFALAATIFSLPDFLCYYFPAKNKWYRTSEFYTIFLIISMGIGGILLSKYSGWISLVILPIGISLAFWEFFLFLRNKNLLALIAGAAFMTFMILLFYSQWCHSVLFPEKIILGKAHIDIIFHSSMSNMFSTLGWASTGLDGSPYIPYHWGSHALFAGLKNWAGLGTLMFYNIAYPAIFLPLFFKTLFSFINRFFVYKGKCAFKLIYAISFMTLIYSLPFALLQFASPMGSESYCMALLFTFLFASILLAYISCSSKNENMFFLYSMITLMFISFFKISNGFVCIVGTAYLYLRTKWNLKSFVRVSFAGIVITLFIYFFVFQSAYLAKPLSLSGRIQTFWVLSDGFITYLLGALIAVLIVLKNKSLANWSELKSIIKSREYIDLEILFVITLAGFLGGILTSSHATDVYYLCSIQLFVSIPYMILFSQNYFDGFHAAEKIKTLFLFMIIMLSIVSRPDLIKGVSNKISGGSRSNEITGSIFEIIQLKKEMLSLTQQQQVLKDFVDELFKLEKESAKKTKCIYIPQEEKWYYESQKYRPYGSAMVATAISGIALIGGVPDSILKSNIFNYGFYYYKKSGQFMANNINDAKNVAFKKGYAELIEYQFIDGKLSKNTFNLKTNL